MSTKPGTICSHNGTNSRVLRMGEQIVVAAKSNGLLDPSGDTVLTMETMAAQWSISSQLYVSFQPSPYASIPASACDDIRAGISQCCRVGEDSLCACGHTLSAHESAKVPRRPGFIKPPKCSCCKNCQGFTYLSMYPEECGQWWLKRRRDFNIADYRRRVRDHPEDYACIGCNLKLSDHETLFETREMRILRGAVVDEQYIPLQDYRNSRSLEEDSGGGSHSEESRKSALSRRFEGVGK